MMTMTAGCVTCRTQVSTQVEGGNALVRAFMETAAGSRCPRCGGPLTDTPILHAVPPLSPRTTPPRARLWKLPELRAVPA